MFRFLVWSCLALCCSAVEGVARPIRVSFYGEEHRGKMMANLKRFNPDKLTCASWDYPLGSVLEVTSERGFSVRVTVTDRGPSKDLVRRENRRLDLSLAAFRVLAGPELGILENVKIRWIR